VQIVSGRGAFVVGRIDSTSGHEAADQIARLMDDAVNRARLFGLTRADVLRLAEERIAAGYEEDTPRISFVECNPYDMQLVSSELSAQIGTTVHTLLLADIPGSGPVDVDIATTSLFHLEEVDRLLTNRGVRVIGVNTLPDPDALQALARLPAGTKVVVVANNEAGVERFALLVRTYCRAETRTLVLPTDDALDEHVPWADVLVSSLSCSTQVTARADGRPVIVLAFHVDPHSAQHLRSAIVQGRRQEVTA
jgi:hypothetical protein